jgi:hypothetical protein
LSKFHRSIVSKLLISLQFLIISLGFTSFDAMSNKTRVSVKDLYAVNCFICAVVRLFVCLLYFSDSEYETVIFCADL